MTRENNINNTLNPYIVNVYEQQEGDRYGYKIIAVIHRHRYWCAYLGPTDWSDQKVADEGRKIEFEKAKRIFPILDYERPYG